MVGQQGITWLGNCRMISTVLVGVCRKGVVVTLVEKPEEFVLGKLSRGLGVAIPELKMREGMVAPVDSPEWTDSGPEATEEG